MNQPLIKLIVNPAAGSVSTGEKWPQLRKFLLKSGLVFDDVCTEALGHAMELAMDATSHGYEMIVGVGGDGTLQEVMNGIMESNNSDKISLGVRGTGRGCDFAHSVGIPRDPRKACFHLLKPDRKTVDVGVIEYEKEGQPARRYFH